MKRDSNSSINLGVYLATMVASLTSIILLYRNAVMPWYMILSLVLLSVAGWTHFLKQVVTCKTLSFDRKMVWFIAMFSFFAIAAPLFYLFVIKDNEEQKS
jgi:hypothetical protein